MPSGRNGRTSASRSVWTTRTAAAQSVRIVCTSAPRKCQLTGTIWEPVQFAASTVSRNGMSLRSSMATALPGPRPSERNPAAARRALA